MKTGKLEIMINSCYGGFGYSKKAIKEYNLKKLKLNPNFIPIKSSNHKDYDFMIARTDEIMIQIYKDFKESINSTYSKIKICEIDKKYEKCYTIKEYDGLERIAIDYKQYKLNQIEQIIDSTMNEIQKLHEITKIIKTKR